MRISRTSKLIFLLALLSLSIIPTGKAEVVTETRYLRSGWYGGFPWGYLGLQNLTSLDSFDYLEKNQTAYTYLGNIQIGFQAWHYSLDSNYMPYLVEELTSGITLLYDKAYNYEGWASAYWNSSEINMSRLDGIEVYFYARFKITASTWTSWGGLIDYAVSNAAIYDTESLCMDKLLASQWNFTFYLKFFRIASPVKRVARIYIGNSTYDSRIENMQFDNGIPEAAFSFSSGLVIAGVIGALVCVVAVSIGLSGKKRR